MHLCHPQCFHSRCHWVREKDGVDSFNDVSRNLKEIAFVLQWNQRATRPVIHADLERLHQRSKGLDIALDAHVPKYHKPRQNRLFLDGGVHCHDERDAGFTRHVIAQQVYALNMEIRHVHLLRNPYFDLLRSQIGKSPLDGFPHRSIDASGYLKFPGSWRAADLKAVEADLTLVIHGGGVYRPRCEWVGSDHVATPLFRDPHESFLARVVVDV